MNINKNQKLFSKLIISLLEQMYEKHNKTLSEICDPVRNSNKEQIINELSKIMFKCNIEDTCINISKAQQMKLYKELCSKINEMFGSEYNAEKECISDILNQTAKDSYYINSFVMAMGINYTLKPVSDKILQKIVNSEINKTSKIWSETLWDDKVNLRKDLKLQVKKFLNGEINVNDIGSVIQKKYRNNKYVTDRLVVDNISRVQEQSNNVWQKNHNIEYVLYMGTLDNKICSNCSQYDGQSYSVYEKPVDLPQHPFCRCTYVSIMDKNWRPQERLDNETKERIPWQEYEKWHKNYVENNPDRLAEEKKYKNRFSDNKQYEKYKGILGKEAPKTFDKFQELKYNDSNKWSDLKQLYKDVNWQTKAQSNIVKGSEHTVPFNAEPNSVFDNYKNGKLESRRYYGKTGKPRLDLDLTDHGNPKEHTVIPHYHDWFELENDKLKRDSRHDNELTKAHKIANRDIL